MGSLVSLDSLNFCTEFLRDRSRKPKIKSFLHQPMRSNWWLSQILWMVFVVLRGLRWLERMSWKSDKKKKVTVCVRGENVLAATTSTPPLRHVGLMLYWSCVDDVQMMRIGKRIWKGWKDLRLVFVKVLHCSSASFVSNKTFNVSPLGLSLCYYASMRQPWGYRFNCVLFISLYLLLQLLLLQPSGTNATISAPHCPLMMGESAFLLQGCIYPSICIYSWRYAYITNDLGRSTEAGDVNHFHSLKFRVSPEFWRSDISKCNKMPWKRAIQDQDKTTSFFQGLTPCSAISSITVCSSVHSKRKGITQWHCWYWCVQCNAVNAALSLSVQECKSTGSGVPVRQSKSGQILMKESGKMGPTDSQEGTQHGWNNWNAIEVLNLTTDKF